MENEVRDENVYVDEYDVSKIAEDFTDVIEYIKPYGMEMIFLLYLYTRNKLIESEEIQCLL